MCGYDSARRQRLFRPDFVLGEAGAGGRPARPRPDEATHANNSSSLRSIVQIDYFSLELKDLPGKDS